jgi:hypothetical protein
MAIWFGIAVPGDADPLILPLGVIHTSQIDPSTLPAHLAAALPEIKRELQADMDRLFVDLGRFTTHELPARFERGHYIGPGADTLDLVAHVDLLKLHKIFRNRMIQFSENRATSTAPTGDPQPYQVSALPVIIGQLEVRLLNPQRRKVIWTGRSDSTLMIQPHTFLYNPRKYPGWNHPDLLHRHLAGIIRLQDNYPAITSMLHAADRWYVSAPPTELETMQKTVALMVQSFYRELDGRLPIEGRISQLLPGQDGKQYARINIGAGHGLVPKLRLDVYRAGPSTAKIAQVEIVQLDSLSAQVRLRKLDKKIRRLGQGLQVGDRILSRRRSSPRWRTDH